jgi:hypothetical protein
VTLVVLFMVMPGMIRHSRYTTPLIGLCQSLCRITFQGSSAASLAFFPVRVSYLSLAFVVVMGRAPCHTCRAGAPLLRECLDKLERQVG